MNVTDSRCDHCDDVVDLEREDYVRGTVCGEPVVIHLCLCRDRYADQIDDEVVVRHPR